MGHRIQHAKTMSRLRDMVGDEKADIFNAVVRIWRKNQHLRLTQLLYNIVNPADPCPGFFYCEDKDLLKKLLEYEEEQNERAGIPKEDS